MFLRVDEPAVSERSMNLEVHNIETNSILVFKKGSTTVKTIKKKEQLQDEKKFTEETGQNIWSFLKSL